MSDSAAAAHGKQLLFFLFITAVLCGALVMVIEVLGSRVVGPFFGVSLFVWTSLITVTLIALAGGYWAGGQFADRRGSAAALYIIILCSGLLVLLVPPLKAPVLKLAQPLGLRGGAFASTLVLFGPSLFLLGCVSPYLIKIAARELHNIGRTVGSFYALSTLGSVAGTVVTGFYLIAYLGVDQIFYTVGFLLILLATAYFAWFRRRYAGLLLCFLPVLMPSPPEFTVRTMADGTRVEQVYNRQSFYGAVKVVDYSFEQTHVRELLINGQVQGGVDMHGRGSIYRYNYFLQFLPRAKHPDGQRCLVVGLGAGVVPMWYERQGVITDVVDIDPTVVQVAREFFAFTLQGELAVQDARYFIEQSPRRYDYIILDVFNGDYTPGHVISREAFAAMAAHLAGGGVLAMNVLGGIGEDAAGTAAVIRTLRAVFDTVEVYPAFDPARDKVGNITLLAYQGPALPTPEFDLDVYDMHPVIRDALRGIFGRQIQFALGGQGFILSDNYNPIDVLDARMREDLRRNILDLTSADLLLSLAPRRTQQAGMPARLLVASD